MITIGYFSESIPTLEELQVSLTCGCSDHISVNSFIATFKFPSNRKYLRELGEQLTTIKDTAVATAISKRKGAEASSAHMKAEAYLRKQHQEALNSHEEIFEKKTEAHREAEKIQKVAIERWKVENRKSFNEAASKKMDQIVGGISAMTAGVVTYGYGAIPVDLGKQPQEAFEKRQLKTQKVRGNNLWSLGGKFQTSTCPATNLQLQNAEFLFIHSWLIFINLRELLHICGIICI